MKKQEVKIFDENIQKEILPFIKDLRENNNRDWFNEHKPRYLTIKDQIEVFTNECIEKIRSFDTELQGVTAKRSMYRIYRDTRFSHDKTPYKRYIGIFISKDGAHGECSGYYIHFEPGNCFVGAGVYGLQPESMKKIRQEIYFKSQEFRDIISTPEVVKQCGVLDESAKMKMPPKGFDKNSPDIELLKYKYYFLVTQISDKEASKSLYSDKVAQVAKLLYPFNCFLNRALSF